MRKNRLLLTLVSASMFGVGLAQNVQAQEPCSVATLQGEYLVTGGAERRTFDPPDDPLSYPRRIVAVWNFDGEGGLTGFTTQNQGGVINRNNLMATYTMDSERCVATLTFGSGSQWDIVLTRDGSEGAAIRVDTDGGDPPRTPNVGTRYLKKR